MKQLQLMSNINKNENVIDYFSSKSKSLIGPKKIGFIDLDPDRVVFFKKRVEIDEFNYVCEISYDKDGFYVSLFGMEHPYETANLHMKNNTKTDRIMRSFNYNFDRLADGLGLRNGRIIVNKSSINENGQDWSEASLMNVPAEDYRSHAHSQIDVLDRRSITNLERMQIQKKLHNERKMELYNLGQQRERMGASPKKAKAQS